MTGVFKGTFKNDERHGRGKSEKMGNEIIEYYENGELIVNDEAEQEAMNQIFGNISWSNRYLIIQKIY